MKYKVRQNFSTDPNQALIEVLQQRGVKDIENFLNASFACELNPYDLDNIEDAAKMLLKHLENDDEILILVDADADGYTSAAIIWLYIKEVFPNSKLSFIVHEHKQHGLNDKVEWIASHIKYKLVIVPDASSFDVEEHRKLHELGIDCVILDHHAQLYDKEGNAVSSNFSNVIIVNNQLSDNYQNKSLCGAGIVYKFCEVLDDMLDKELSHQYMDLVALGEIADVMDRTNPETNYLMLQGLSNIYNKGFQTLLAAQAYSLKEKAYPPWPKLNAIDIAFYIAPLINAIVRVGTMEEKEVMFYCFIEPDRLVPSTKRGATKDDTETAAEQTARVGKNAKARQDRIKEKAIEILDDKIKKQNLDINNILVIEVSPEDDIPQELSGLAAMNIVTKYNKPCLVVRRNSEGMLQGSARSNSNFSELPDFKQYLDNSGYFEYVAGHAGAFGAGIKASRLEAFLNFVNKDLSSDAFENCYTVDYILSAKDNIAPLLYELSSHPEYFGNHIDEIKYIIKDIPLTKTLVMGANKDSIRISYNNIDYIRFKDEDFIEKVLAHPQSTITIYARGNINNFNGKESVQCFIDDYDIKINSDKYAF